MSAAILLDELRARGFTVRISGERLLVRPSVPPGLREQLAAAKDEILALLRAGPATALFDPATRPPPPDSVWPLETVPVEELLDLVEEARAARERGDTGPAVAARPRDAQGSHSTADRTSISLAPCRLCFSMAWWRLIDAGRGAPGDWVCGVCHPPLARAELIERAEVDGA